MARIFKEILIFASAIIALTALMLPSLLPDFIPLIGWMDEGAATLTLINVMKYYGLDLTNLYGRPQQRRVVRRVIRAPEQREEKMTDDPVRHD